MWYDQPISPTACIPRELMPQVDEANYDALFAFASENGMAVRRVVFPPNSLRTHQRVNRDYAKSMIPPVRCKPILASAEPYVLDGNHRTASHRFEGSPVPAWQFDAPFDKAMQMLFAFPGTYYYGDGNFHPISY